jgi:hypothetical protein
MPHAHAQNGADLVKEKNKIHSGRLNLCIQVPTMRCILLFVSRVMMLCKSLSLGLLCFVGVLHVMHVFHLHVLNPAQHHSAFTTVQEAHANVGTDSAVLEHFIRCPLCWLVVLHGCDWPRLEAVCVGRTASPCCCVFDRLVEFPAIPLCSHLFITFYSSLFGTPAGSTV